MELEEKGRSRMKQRKRHRLKWGRSSNYEGSVWLITYFPVARQCCLMKEIRPNDTRLLPKHGIPGWNLSSRLLLNKKFKTRHFI